MVRSPYPPRRGTRQGSGRRLTAAAFALAIGGLSPPAFAADDPLLSGLVGSWIGRGTFTASATAEPELVYCKVTNTLDSGGTTLQQKGRCAVSTNSSSVKGTIKAAGGGRYEGTLESLSSTGPAAVSGTGSGGKLQLVAEFIDRKTKKPTKASLSLTIAAGKYRLVSETVGPDGKKHSSTDVVFTPQ